MSFGGSSKRIDPTTQCGVDLNAHRDDPTVIGVADTTGAKWVRRTVTIALVDADAGYVADMVTRLTNWHTAGYKVLVLFSGENPANSALPRAARYALFAKSALQFVQALPMTVAVELFNEQAGTTFDDIFMGDAPGLTIGGQRYGDFLNVAAPILRAGRVSSIVSGGIFDVDVSGGWIAGMMSRLIPGNLDAVGTHAYGFPPEGQVTAAFRAVKRDGWTGEQWLTEFGMDDTQYPWDTDETTDYDVIQRCCLMGGTFDAAPDPAGVTTFRGCVPSNPGYRRMFVYVVHNVDESDIGFPIFKSGYSPRAVVAEVAAWNADRPDWSI